jgi:imidazolonepropionase-like amidohydrolase
VRSIEHGNQLDEASAVAMAEAGAFLSQTNVTYLALRESGRAAGMPAALVAKVGGLVEQGTAAVALARRHGVRITYGSDLLGDMRGRQLEGFKLLLDSGMTAAEALACATSVGAELMNLNAGAIRPGLLADMALLRVNPLDERKLRALSQDDIARVWVAGKRAV